MPGQRSGQSGPVRACWQQEGWSVRGRVGQSFCVGGDLLNYTVSTQTPTHRVPQPCARPPLLSATSHALSRIRYVLRAQITSCLQYSTAISLCVPSSTLSCGLLDLSAAWTTTHTVG